MNQKFIKGEIVVYAPELGMSSITKPTYAEFEGYHNKSFAAADIIAPIGSLYKRRVDLEWVHKLTREQEEDFVMAKLEDRHNMEVEEQ